MKKKQKSISTRMMAIFGALIITVCLLFSVVSITVVKSEMIENEKDESKKKKLIEIQNGLFKKNETEYYF